MEIGLTYDDVLLVPAYSEVLPDEVDTSTELAPGLRLSIPILSAAMDTVTEHQMAIAMASAGGLGVIHKNLPISVQAEEVRRVKRYESGLIVDPITLPPTARVGEALALMREHRIGGIPIVEQDRRLVGILTNRDLRFVRQEEYGEPVSNYMTKAPLVTAPEGTSLEEAERILRMHRIEKLPLLDRAGRLIGLITYKDILRRRSYPYACKDELGRLRVGAAVGVGEGALERAEALVQAGVDVLVIDTAHAHSKRVIETLQQMRERFPRQVIMVGNIATAQAARDLIAAGADILKVGIGPGSICTTRVVAGVGVPQLSAVMAVAEVARPAGVGVVADGGIRYSGDVVKALCGRSRRRHDWQSLSRYRRKSGRNDLIRGAQVQSLSRDGVLRGHASGKCGSVWSGASAGFAQAGARGGGGKGALSGARRRSAVSARGGPTCGHGLLRSRRPCRPPKSAVHPNHPLRLRGEPSPFH
jgi:IMP dehydrogenase